MLQGGTSETGFVGGIADLVDDGQVYSVGNSSSGVDSAFRSAHTPSELPSSPERSQGGASRSPPRSSCIRGSHVVRTSQANVGLMNAAGAQGAADSIGNNMFADADALRQGIHANIAKKDYDVSQFYYESGAVQAIARSRKFGMLTLFVIAVNAIWIGLDTDCNDAKFDGYLTGCPAQPSDDFFWSVGEHFFCAFFSFELLVRFGAFEKKRNSLRDNWFKFDSLLVSFMVLETWIIPAFPGNGADSLSDLSLLRMLRLLRLTRMVRLMRSVPELVTLLKGMAIASRSVSYTLLLLLIFMYIFAIVFKSQLENTQSPGLQAAFHNIPRSMWTLLLSGCMLDDLTTVANLLVKESFFMAGAFVLFVLLAALMVLNMLVGVLCAVVTAVAAAEKEKALVSLVKTRLMSVLETLDVDGNGTISQLEFDRLVHIPEAVYALEELGVDVSNLASLSDALFDQEEKNSEDSGKIHRSIAKVPQSGVEDSLSDTMVTIEEQVDLQDGEEEDVADEVSMTFAEFLEMVIRLRADNSPSVADIVELRKLIFKGQRTIAKRFHSLEKGQSDLQKGIKLIFKQLDIAQSRHSELEESLSRRRRESSNSLPGDTFDTGLGEACKYVPNRSRRL